MDGVTEVTGATLDMLGDTQDIGEADGATLAITDLIMDTITTHTITEEEDLLLIMVEEIMVMTETTLVEETTTETIQQIEITPQTEGTIQRTDQTATLTLEEVRL